MDTTNKKAFGNRSQSVTKSNFGSTAKTNQDQLLFTKDIGLNKYVMKTLAEHIQVHQDEDSKQNQTEELRGIRETEGEEANALHQLDHMKSVQYLGNVEAMDLKDGNSTKHTS